MAFGECGGSNYVRIQGNGFIISKKTDGDNDVMSITKEMMGQRNVESHLFKGKKMSEVTNLEKIERIGAELIREHQRRKTTILPTVVLKQLQHYSPTPRTSSASASTSISTQSSSSSSPSSRC